MRKWLTLTALAAAMGMASTAALAQHHGGGGHGGGGWHGGGGQGGSWDGGGWHGGGWHGGHGHGGHVHGSFSVFLGPSFYWGPAYYPGYWYDTPAYYGPTYYYEDPAPVYVEPAPAAPASTYRYYCPSGGYWPDVKSCPQGWLRVLPD